MQDDMSPATRIFNAAACLKIPLKGMRKGGISSLGGSIHPCDPFDIIAFPRLGSSDTFKTADIHLAIPI